jgi:hypothetical protein
MEIFMSTFLSPKIAVPMRTMVAPSATAASRSWDMPIDRVSSGSPARESRSRSSRSGGRRALGLVVRSARGIAHQAAQASAAAARRPPDTSASASSGAHAAFAGLAADIDLDADGKRRQMHVGAAPTGARRSSGVRCSAPTKMFGDQTRLVALQRADEMPLKTQRRSASTLSTPSCT